MRETAMERKSKEHLVVTREVVIPVENKKLAGILTIPNEAQGLVVFVHGSGSSRLSPRNRFVAEALNRAGLATLLFDLLTTQEERVDICTAQLRFDIDFLAKRVSDVFKWLKRNELTKHLPIGYFGASTGAAAAIVSAAQNPSEIHAIVSRGGRPDLAGYCLQRTESPTLFIVGQNDHEVIELNKQAFIYLPESTPKSMAIVPRATHLFEEPGTLESVCDLACGWFATYLKRTVNAA
jgi:putative phosphoribosyl transferase